MTTQQAIEALHALPRMGQSFDRDSQDDGRRTGGSSDRASVGKP